MPLSSGDASQWNFVPIFSIGRVVRALKDWARNWTVFFDRIRWPAPAPFATPVFTASSIASGRRLRRISLMNWAGQEVQAAGVADRPNSGLSIDHQMH